MHPKLQHYVPQFYLRNFATKGKKGYLVCCFDKTTRKAFRPNIKNIAGQTRFYDFIDGSGNEVSIEESFSDIETETSLALQELIENPRISTLLPHKKTLAHFFALQESRTQVFRDAQNDLIKNANQRFRKDGFSFPVPTKDEEKEFQACFLIDTSSDFANVLLEMKWILIINRTRKSFWTSDNPIFKYNPIKSDLVGNLGLKCEGIQVHIPISPHLVIVICDPIGYARENDEATAEFPNIDFNNSGQVLHSRQHIFSADNDFQLAQKMIDENPEVSNPNRPRVVMMD
jgi:hypothetical protein